MRLLISEWGISKNYLKICKNYFLSIFAHLAKNWCGTKFGFPGNKKLMFPKDLKNTLVAESMFPYMFPNMFRARETCFSWPDMIRAS